jgi:periplasmic protein TonB
MTAASRPAGGQVFGRPLSPVPTEPVTSPGRRLVGAVLGTVALHGLIALALGELERLVPIVPERRTVEIEVTEREEVPVVDPEPAPAPEPVAPPVLAPAVEPPPPRPARTQRAAATTASPATETSPPVTDEPAGGTPVLTLPDLGEATRGVAVAPGPRGGASRGTGGAGGGTGTGTGTGSGDAPVSVASIKTRAMPRKGYDYVGLGRDYPAEARRRGIEGAIRVRLVVDARGKVAEARLLNRLGHGLDELALAHARQIEFHPARDTADQPVASVVVWTVNFVLPDA